MIKKVYSFTLSLILILGLISFAHSADPETQIEFDANKFIEDARSTPAGELSNKIEELDSNDKINNVLELIKTKINDESFKENREIAERIAQDIIKTKSQKDISFEISSKAKIDKLEITGDEEGKESLLKIDIKGKEFNIDLKNLPEKVKGIEIEEDRIIFNIEKDGSKKVELTEPSHKLIEKDGKLTIENYKGLDGKEHEIEILFDNDARVTFKENGEIEISGSVSILDPKTDTKFSLFDKAGKPGIINFYEEGHIVKTIGNDIVIEKETLGLKIQAHKNPENGLFILSKNSLTKESTNYPSGFSSQNSFIIDPEGKKIFIPEGKDSTGKIEGKGYTLFGIPSTPSGGIVLDGKNAFGGGKILGKETPPPVKGGDTPDGGGDAGTGKPPGGGGVLGSLLPWILGGVGILIAVLLIAKSKGNDKENSENSSDNYQGGNEPDNYGYNPKSSSKDNTGKTAPSEPNIQSVYKK